MSINKDLYAVLGVSSTALSEEIKKAFRLKASEFHPDKNSADLASIKFREIREAYEILVDPTTRLDYDDNRRRNLLESPLETAQEVWAAYMLKVLK